MTRVLWPVRRRLAAVAVAAAAAAASSGLLTGATTAARTVPAARTAQGGTWGTARELPVSSGVGNQLTAGPVSCAAPGDCSTGGEYNYVSGYQVFVVGEVNGVWGGTKELPGMTALNQQSARLSAMSCASPGNCAAGGIYDADNSFDPSTAEAFVANETNGTWGQAQEVPGLGALNRAGLAGLLGVSCPSPGDCVAVGFFSQRAKFDRTRRQAFIADEVDGTWQPAHKVGASLNTGGDAELSGVSCASKGNCTAVGSYSARHGTTAVERVMVDAETNGVWGAPRELPGVTQLPGTATGIDTVSCPAPGTCGISGTFADSANTTQPFLDDEVKGTWGTPAEVPGIAGLDLGNYATISSLSCAAPRECAAGGTYSVSRISDEPFVVDETNGTWGSAQEVPGIAALSSGPFDIAGLSSLSCGAAGECAAVGNYDDAKGETQPFVVDEVHGTWGDAEAAPGIAALNLGCQGFGVCAYFVSLSCPSAGNCGATGSYQNNLNFQATFVIDGTSKTQRQGPATPGGPGGRAARRTAG